MKTLDYLPLDMKYLGIVIGKRSNSDIGNLVKNLFRYVKDGTNETLADEAMEMMRELLLEEIDAHKAKAEHRSQTNSRNASVKNGSGSAVKQGTANSNGRRSQKKNTAANNSDGDKQKPTETIVSDCLPSPAMAETAPTDEPELFSHTMANEITCNEQLKTMAQSESEDLSFEHFCDLYPESRHGGNADEAAEQWNALADDERRNAISHTIAANASNGYRSYLYVYLRDKEWIKSKH